MAFIILLAICIALVWGTWYVFYGSPVLGCLVFLLTACCFGHEWFNFDLGPIPLTLDRLVIVAIVGAAAAQWWLGRLDVKPLRVADKIAVFFMAVLTLRSFGEQSERVVFGDMPPLMRLTLGYLLPLTVYFLARNSRISNGGLQALYVCVIMFGLYLATTGLLEISGQWWAVFPRYISDPEVGLHFGRARGPMVQAVTFGLFLGTCLLTAWISLVRVPRLCKPPLVAAMMLFAAAIYYSYTRSVWLGAAVGLFVVLGFTLHASWRRLVLGSMIALALILGATKADSIVGFKREGSVADTRESVSMRGSFTYVSWKMFLDRPVWGFGFGQFPHAKLPYLADRSTDLHLEVIRPYVHHNTFLSLLTETGVIGMGLFVALLIGWCRQSVCLCQQAVPDWIRMQAVLSLGVLGLYTCQLLAHELSYTPLDNSLVFLIVGLTSGLYGQYMPAVVETQAEQGSTEAVRKLETAAGAS